MNLGFWKNKKVLVSGHTGFKGSWLCSWLKGLGAEVVGLALPPPSEPNMFTTSSVGAEMSCVEGDIRDIALVRSVMQEHRPEIVLHLAAQALVRQSYEDPVETFGTNVMGTVHMLEAIKECPSVRVAVMITSDKCYDNREWHWGYREIDPMGGADPYSSSKGCAELVSAAYARSFFSAPTTAHIASARAGNVIGGGDWATDRLIPDIIRAFGAGETVTIRSPGAIRPWQHVLEPLRGYLSLTEAIWENGEAFAEAWNFGPHDDDAQPVAHITGRLAELWGADAGWKIDAGDNPHEATYLKLDCSKAQMRLGWRPLLDLDTTLQWLVEWYRAYDQNADTRGITAAQIRRYEALIEGQPSRR